MSVNTSSQEERDDLKRRQELQTKLQEAVRRSASENEIRNIQSQIEKLNTKIESYANRTKKTGT